MEKGIVENKYTDRKFPSLKISGKFYSADLKYGKPCVDLAQFNEGDEVEFTFVMNGEYKNIISIQKLGQDTSFDHGANRENRPDEERVVSSQPIVSSTNNDMDTYLQAVDTAYDKSQKFNNLRNLDGENLRAVCIGAAIQHMRSNGR